MTRTLDPVLEQVHRRANPLSCDIVEISAPDKGLVLRRASDQFFSNPPRFSEAPANSSAADSGGALQLTPTANQVANLYNDNGTVSLPGHDPSAQIYGVYWKPDPAFGRAILRSFTAKIKRASANNIDVQLQIYRARRIATATEFLNRPSVSVQTVFVPLLPEPAVIKHAKLTWAADHTDAKFDLSPYRLEVKAGPDVPDGQYNSVASTPYHTSDMPGYYFTVHPVNPSKVGMLEWKKDNTSSRTVAGIGTFNERDWKFLPPGPGGAWRLQTDGGAVPMMKMELESFAATSAIVYAIDLGGVPIALSTGRIVFERATPGTTSATLEISTAGTGGPWTVVKHGDVVTIKQQTYHLRLTMNADAAARNTPRVSQVGIEFRVPVDVSAETRIEPLTHAADMPWCKASIGEGHVHVVRTGRRDYRDLGADIAVGNAPTKLEVDHFLGSRHPRVTRDRWMLVDRIPVNDRHPSQGTESFGILSILKQLKRKVPQRVETINKLHTVVTATTAQAQVTPNLQGATGTGSYFGLHYYIRIRSSTQTGVQSGYMQEIDNNTNLDKLDFTSVALPGTLIAGDVIEVHSAQYTQPALQWIDADPADIWWELLTTHLVIPPEKIGLGGSGAVARSGLPPRATDRAPGDATTQAKLKVTIKIKEEEECDKLIDQLSFLMGGVTVAIAGQILFRQIYPLRAADGTVTVSAGGSVRTLDARDYAQLETPTGVEKRITSLACDYGVDLTALSDETQPTQTVDFVDGDALAYLAAQDVEGLGQGVVSKDIARWCYNSADAGKFLATQVCQQVVNATSTGLRLWSFTTMEQEPDLTIGDVVTIVTDGYTDYDPTRKMIIRGWWGFALVIVSVGAGGRRFVGFMLGLGNASRVQGGTGTLTTDATVSRAPMALITKIQETPRAELLQFTGALGGVGPLQWRYKLNFGVFTAWSATVLPQNLQVNKKPFLPQVVQLQTMQADGQIANAQHIVHAMHEATQGSTAGRTDEDRNRSGTGGLMVTKGLIHTHPQYTRDGTTPLVDPDLGQVTDDLKASDGVKKIESRRGSQTKSAAGAGHASRGIMQEGHDRAGSGGMMVLGKRILAEGLYDATGALPLVDTGTKMIQPDLFIGADVKGHSTVKFGNTVKHAPMRHTENFTGTDTTTLTFGLSYDNVPEITIVPANFTLPGASSTVDKKIEFQYQDPGVSGCTLRAKQTTSPTSSAQSENPSTVINGTTAATQTLNSASSVAFWNLTNANTTTTRYTVKYDVDTTGMPDGLLTVKLWKNLSVDGTATWIQVASATYDVGGTWTNESLFFDGAMAANYDLKLTLSKSTGGPFGAVVTAKACTYDKITGGTETALTPASLIVQTREKS